MSQEQGLIGRCVGMMIRSSVRKRLRNLYWSPPEAELHGPVVLYANHHGWLDGYLMFHAVTKLKIRCLDWIEEFDSFPLFRYIGGMRYPRADALVRATTVRRTIRSMRDEGRSLVLFAEGILHRPPDILPFGRSLELIAKKVPEAKLVPVSIYYEESMHERPEAWIGFGQAHGFESLEDCRLRLCNRLESLVQSIRNEETFEILAKGTPSINERMSMKRFSPK